MQALAASTLANLTTLTSLDVSENWIDNTGFQALARPLDRLDSNTRLTSLIARKCYVGDQGLQAFVHSARSSGLTSLDVENNRISTDGLQALATSANFQALSFLCLSENKVGDYGLQALAGSVNFPKLSCLKVSETGLARLDSWHS